ncbi:MAG: LysM peptidoglycan-binding domain-containing protein [Pseudomonadota bacterium]
MNPLVIKALYLVGGSGAAVGGAVATGIIPAGVFTDFWSQPKTEVVRLADPAPKTKVPAKPKPVETEAKASEKITQVEPPKFDILRLEKDGSLLVAGNAEPNSSVELIAPDGTVLGVTKAGPGGDFVILPNNSLKPGGHSLSLRATGPSGKPVLSKQAGILNVPQPDEAPGNTTALAMISEAGAPSRVITKPETLVKEPVKELVAEPEPKEVEVAKVPEPQKPTAVEPKAVVPVAKTEPKPEPVKTQTEPAPKSAPRVIVEAVEVEGKQVFIAGEVKRGSLVRVYIDNKLVGSARGTQDNRFLVAKPFDLEPGKHSVRVDLVSPATGKVMSRAQVPLIHEAPVVATATAPKPQPAPKPVQTAKLEKLTGAPKIFADEPKVVSTVVARTPEPIADTAPTLRTGTAVIIKPGDNLWRISRRTYGAGIRYTTIYNANRDQIRDPSRIYVGQIFKIPDSATGEPDREIN